MKKLIAKYPNYQHDILIADNNLASSIVEFLNKNFANSQIVAIVDKNIENIVKQKFCVEQNTRTEGHGNHHSKCKINFIFQETSEQLKNLSCFENLLNKLFELNVKRNDVLLAIGGGVLTDLVGFVASSYMRGINYINVPTTLLAMVDASVGGKTAVNNKFGKNLIGNFYHPSAIFIDTSFLQSLPPRTFWNGMSEVIKYGLIMDESFFNWLANLKEINNLQSNNNLLTKIIEHSINCKLKIVCQDFKEKNHRKILNLGHTFGHALETITEYSNKLNHGEAISIGMVMAAKYSIQKQATQSENNQINLENIKSIFHKFYLPTKLSFIKNTNINAEIMTKIMTKDKKNTSDEIQLILLNKIGECYTQNASKAELINFFKNSYNL